MKKEKTDALINTVAKEISNLIPNCCGVTLGGSRDYGFEDNNSDVEMYFYSHHGAPSVDSITKCLNKLNAKHKRTNSFLWNNKRPWGPHSFFVIDGVYFEIGYRNIDEIRERIMRYLNGKVAPEKDCHDLGFGYMTSGLAASVIAEKPLILCNDELYELKKIAESFPEKLMEKLKIEYFNTAKSLIEGKLLAAAERCDIFLYEAISGRIMRCLIIMAFAISKKHFPGDKWNEQLLNKLDWQNKTQFIELLKKHILYKATTKEEFFERRKCLIEAFELINKEVGDNNG